MSDSFFMDKQYDPKAVETKWYDIWIDAGYFTPKPSKLSEKPYVITIPPPNVTGELHMGHALQHSIHDLLIRWKRMQGHETLCLPGMDHASIPVQMLVERQLRQEGVSRLQLGREKFLERVWQWKERYGGEILRQLRRLGCTYDWSRERFTMDPGYSRAVLTAFVRYYERGWIYRGNRVINWCTSCQTALSDLEVDYREEDGYFYHIAYPMADGSGILTVATARPETMLGDTAVAVHPDDPRYAGIIGTMVTLPLVGREIPVIGDPILVDPQFGSGVVKVTPAHDLNDFECGLRNSLPQEVVIDKNGKMALGILIDRYQAEILKQFDGMPLIECRQAVVEQLRQSGALITQEPYHHSVATCDRCHTVIEPLLSEQWFVRMKDLADMAMGAVRQGDVRFVPDRYAKIFFDWMENIRDWCISRQVWWGHRMPVWHCQTCQEFIVSIDRPERCAMCGRGEIGQDENTLDTWFSSALWTFATMGWPDETDDLKRYHPTSLLITDRQIINLWVARMIYSSLAFLNAVPFREIYIHATVLDRHGQRMSKTKGNVVNPVMLIDSYGADATRFGLISMAAKGQDIRFSDERILAARNFCNKLWNAARFVLMNADQIDGGEIIPSALTDRWILSRLERTIQTVTTTLNDYEFSEATKALYEFTWGDYCDWYVELSKSRLATGDEVVRRILLHTLQITLKLLHPFLPFITEEIWQRVTPRMVCSTKSTHLIGAEWPEVERGHRYSDPQAEEEMSLLQEIVTAIRNIRGEMMVPPLQRTSILIRTTDPEQAAILQQNAGIIIDLTRSVEVQVDGRLTRPKRSGGTVVRGIDVWVPLDGAIDIEAERMRLSKEAKKIGGLLEGLERKLADRNFLERAPAEIIERERGKIDGHRRTLERITANLNVLEE